MLTAKLFIGYGKTNIILSILVINEYHSLKKSNLWFILFLNSLLYFNEKLFLNDENFYLKLI